MDKENKELFQEIIGRFDKMDERLDRMDEHLHVIDGRLDVLEYKQDRMAKKLEDIQLDVKIFERETKRHFKQFDDKVDTVIEVLKINNLIPQ